MTEDSEEQAVRLREMLIAARAAHEARCAAIEAGEAEPWVYKARDTAYAVADHDDPTDDVRRFVTSQIAEYKPPEGKSIEGKAVGESIGKRLRRVDEWRDGGGFLRFINSSVFNSIRTDFQATRLPNISQLTASTSAIQSIVAMQNMLQQFGQWHALTAGSDLQRSLRSAAEFNERLTRWSSAVTAMSRGPNISALRSALALPTAELRWLTGTTDELSTNVRQSLVDVSTAMDEEDQPGSPRLLSDWLGWLPSTAQARLLILILVAVNALIEYVDVETGVEPPDHLTVLIYAIAAVATVLNEYVTKG